MIISDKYKCIFIRVPKTGSTSIESLWKTIDPDCQISDIYNPPYGHFKCSELKRVLGEKVWNSYFKFAFIREPKSWFKSQYTDNMKYQHELNSSIHILLNKDYMLYNPSDRTFKLNDCITRTESIPKFKIRNKIRYAVTWTICPLPPPRLGKL